MGLWLNWPIVVKRQRRWAEPGSEGGTALWSSCHHKQLMVNGCFPDPVGLGGDPRKVGRPLPDQLSLGVHQDIVARVVQSNQLFIGRAKDVEPQL